MCSQALQSQPSASRAPHVAYLIASHALPDQLLRLASVLRRGSPDASLVLHYDDRRTSIDVTKLDALGVRRLEPSAPAAWGEVSLLEMVLRGLRWCLDHTDFDWLVLISGQDYPIRPVVEIERSLADAEVEALIETRPCVRPPLGASVDEFAGRYHFRWQGTESRMLASLARAATRKGSFVRTRALPSGTWIGVRALRSPFGPELLCHSGSDWFTLSRTAVQAVDRFLRDRPDILHYYRRTLHPTESFIQTVLANNPSVRVSCDYRRYTVWDGPKQTGPRVLRMSDLDEILASGCDFARKFDETVDRAILDEIDRRIHSTSQRR